MRKLRNRVVVSFDQEDCPVNGRARIQIQVLSLVSKSLMTMLYYL